MSPNGGLGGRPDWGEQGGAGGNGNGWRCFHESGAKELKLVDAARLLEVSYRPAKRLWKRYREEGPAGLQHRSVGCRSNRAKPEKFRRKVLGLVRKKYSGEQGQRFGPTLAAEH